MITAFVQPLFTVREAKKDLQIINVLQKYDLKVCNALFVFDCCLSGISLNASLIFSFAQMWVVAALNPISAYTTPHH
jgi:hypothetical protein